MCGRFTLHTDLSQIQKAFQLDHVALESEPSYNVAPTQSVLAVVRQDGENVLTRMRWGLVPVWAKDMSIGSKMINARAETLAEKPAFKRLLKSRRCLVVADGFYEWRKQRRAEDTDVYPVEIRRPVRLCRAVRHLALARRRDDCLVYDHYRPAQ